MANFEFQPNAGASEVPEDVYQNFFFFTNVALVTSVQEHESSVVIFHSQNLLDFSQL